MQPRKPATQTWLSPWHDEQATYTAQHIMAFKASSKQARLQPSVEKEDCYAGLARAILDCATAAGDPIDRALAALRCVLIATITMVSASSDPQDLPVPLLGQHWTTKRALGYSPDGAPHMGIIQELCSFDTQEKPREFAWEQGDDMGRMHLTVEPTCKAKTRKLGRQQYLKIDLGSGILELRPPSADAADTPEVYEFKLPSLVLKDPLSPACSPALKGEVTMVGVTTGITASLNILEDGRVVGTLDQRQEAPIARSIAIKGSQQYGKVSGSLKEGLTVACPELGVIHQLLGPVADQAAAGCCVLLAPLDTFDLSTSQPMHLHRLWSAVLDSIARNDPRKAVGKGSQTLSHQVSQIVNGYPLGLAGRAPVSKILPAPGLISRGTAPSAKSGAHGEGNDDGDDDDELLLVGKAREDARSSQTQHCMPPCILAQHAQGRVLKYQLHIQVRQLANSLLKAKD